MRLEDTVLREVNKPGRVPYSDKTTETEVSSYVIALVIVVSQVIMCMMWLCS